MSELMDDIDKFEEQLTEPPKSAIWFYAGDRKGQYAFHIHYEVVNDV